MESPEERLRLEQSSTEQLSRMIAGGRIAQIIAVTAELGIPDLLKDGPRSDSDLAQASGTHGPTLRRLLRALASLGLVRLAQDDYALTPLGAALRSDTPERLDLTARYIGSEARWRTWGHLLHSIRTGGPAFSDVFGMQPWEYDEQHPEFGRLFDELMTAGSRTRQEAILAAYDFSRFGTVVDVAGGRGQLIGAVLQRNPNMRGILFDQPHVLSAAPATLAEMGVEDRCVVIAGSFFDAVPSGGDAYLLKFILHDWDDERALAILQTVSRSITPGATLLVIDRVLPDDRPPEVGDAVMDLHMLVLFGGKERRESDFRSMYAQAGFRLTRIMPTASDVSLIEGIRT